MVIIAWKSAITGAIIGVAHKSMPEIVSLYLTSISIALQMVYPGLTTPPVTGMSIDDQR